MGQKSSRDRPEAPREQLAQRALALVEAIRARNQDVAVVFSSPIGVGREDLARHFCALSKNAFRAARAGGVRYPNDARAAAERRAEALDAMLDGWTPGEASAEPHRREPKGERRLRRKRGARGREVLSLELARLTLTHASELADHVDRLETGDYDDKARLRVFCDGSAMDALGGTARALRRMMIADEDDERVASDECAALWKLSAVDCPVGHRLHVYVRYSRDAYDQAVEALLQRSLVDPRAPPYLRRAALAAADERARRATARAAAVPQRVRPSLPLARAGLAGGSPRTDTDGESPPTRLEAHGASAAAAAAADPEAVEPRRSAHPEPTAAERFLRAHRDSLDEFYGSNPAATTDCMSIVVDCDENLLSDADYAAVVSYKILKMIDRLQRDGVWGAPADRRKRYLSDRLWRADRVVPVPAAVVRGASGASGLVDVFSDGDGRAGRSSSTSTSSKKSGGGEDDTSSSDRPFRASDGSLRAAAPPKARDGSTGSAPATLARASRPALATDWDAASVGSLRLTDRDRKRRDRTLTTAERALRRAAAESTADEGVGAYT